MHIHHTEVFVEKIEGNGNINFVLIHNAGGDHRFFTHQVETLKNYGNIIQLDLPGHGKSSTIPRYHMEDVSALVMQICTDLSLQNICCIGLNNGANIIIDMLNRYSLPITHAVLIDPPLYMDKKFVDEIQDFIQQLESSHVEDFITYLANTLFLDTTIENKHMAHAAFSHANKSSLQKILSGLIEWDKNAKEVLKKINIPCLCILTDEHHCTYKKLKEEATQNIEIGKVVGSKCWATLEVPDQVNAMIKRFLEMHAP